MDDGTPSVEPSSTDTNASNASPLAPCRPSNDCRWHVHFDVPSLTETTPKWHDNLLLWECHQFCLCIDHIAATDLASVSRKLDCHSFYSTLATVPSVEQINPTENSSTVVDVNQYTDVDGEPSPIVNVLATVSPLLVPLRSIPDVLVLLHIIPSNQLRIIKPPCSKSMAVSCPMMFNWKQSTTVLSKTIY